VVAPRFRNGEQTVEARCFALAIARIEANRNRELTIRGPLATSANRAPSGSSLSEDRPVAAAPVSDRAFTFRKRPPARSQREQDDRFDDVGHAFGIFGKLRQVRNAPRSERCKGRQGSAVQGSRNIPGPTRPRAYGRAEAGFIVIRKSIFEGSIQSTIQCTGARIGIPWGLGVGYGWAGRSGLKKMCVA